jgi:hypothetical protein
MIACRKWALLLCKERETHRDETVIALESDTSYSDGNNTSVVSELEHYSGRSKPEPVTNDFCQQSLGKEVDDGN